MFRVKNGKSYECFFFTELKKKLLLTLPLIDYVCFFFIPGPAFWGLINPEWWVVAFFKNNFSVQNLIEISKNEEKKFEFHQNYLSFEKFQFQKYFTYRSLCNKGRRQSPVNLEPNRLLFDPNLRPLHIDKHRV